MISPAGRWAACSNHRSRRCGSVGGGHVDEAGDAEHRIGRGTATDDRTHGGGSRQKLRDDADPPPTEARFHSHKVG